MCVVREPVNGRWGRHSTNNWLIDKPCWNGELRERVSRQEESQDDEQDE
jgi:hypothetical protein